MTRPRWDANIPTDERSRLRRVGFGYAIVSVMAMVAMGVPIVRAYDFSRDDPAGMVLLCSPFYPGLVLWFVWAFQATALGKRHDRAPRAAARQAKARPRAAARDDDWDSPHYYTNGYDPERWFRYSVEERAYMRDYGMPADIYDSNVRDHDPN